MKGTVTTLPGYAEATIERSGPLQLPWKKVRLVATSMKQPHVVMPASHPPRKAAHGQSYDGETGWGMVLRRHWDVDEGKLFLVLVAIQGYVVS